MEEETDEEKVWTPKQAAEYSHVMPAAVKRGEMRRRLPWFKDELRRIAAELEVPAMVVSITVQQYYSNVSITMADIEAGLAWISTNGIEEWSYTRRCEHGLDL